MGCDQNLREKQQYLVRALSSLVRPAVSGGWCSCGRNAFKERRSIRDVVIKSKLSSVGGEHCTKNENIRQVHHVGDEDFFARWPSSSRTLPLLPPRHVLIFLVEYVILGCTIKCTYSLYGVMMILYPIQLFENIMGNLLVFYLPPFGFEFLVFMVMMNVGA